MTIPLVKNLKKHVKFKFKKKTLLRFLRSSMWFILGATLGFFFFISFLYVSYKKFHENLIYEGVMVNNVDFGGKTKQDVQKYFGQKNKFIKNITVTLKEKDVIATVSAKQIEFGYDENLLAQQAFSIGRSDNLVSDISLIVQAYIVGVDLSPAYHYKEDKLNKSLQTLQSKLDVEPVDALFHFEDGKVKEFTLSSDGRVVNTGKLKQEIATKMAETNYNIVQSVTIPVPMDVVKPKISSEEVNKMGIKELIGRGTSLFHHSIENRIFNLTLASTKLDGVLIPPGEVFSTAKTIGDISAATGYKSAYVISGGKTVLGDGGGVCQVSTTLFRAALNAGLPIVERNAHAYRVGYYEQDSGPGVDAAIYYPTVDFKFKNDTGNYILIQTYVDPVEQALTFELYGTSDGRVAKINEPVVLSQSPAPEALYQDDPTLPSGQIKQVDFAAAGAKVFFTRTVTKDGKEIISDKFVSNYRPWQAVYLRGTM